MSDGSNGVNGAHLRAFIEKFCVSDLVAFASINEVWKPICGFPGYSISSFGRASGKRIGILKLGRVKDYLTVCLSRGKEKKTFRVNILVASAFIGPKPFNGAIVAHNDGREENNNVGNLRWASLKENQADCNRHGTRRFGSDIHNAKLNERDIPVIRERITSGERYPPIANDYGVSVSTIHLIAKNKIWKRANGASWRPSA